MSKAQILSQLQYLAEQEKIEADATALTLLASAADGSMRDALSLLDQAIGYGAGVVRQDAVESMLGSISRDNLIRLFDALVDQQATTLLREARMVIEHNPDYQRICAEMIALLQHCALYQNDPGLLNEDEFGEQLLQKYSSHWSAEEIQLFYQILLQGRQDLLICPDEATGFEMLMLRLLAFSPMPEASVLNVEVKKKPESGHVVNQSTVDQTSPDSDRVTDQPARPVLEPATDLLLNPPQIKPVADQADTPLEQEVDEQALLESSAQTDRPLSVATAADADLDWSALAYELELAGLAQEIVANSWLLSWQDGKLKLELQAEIYELINDLIKTEILQALEQKLGVSLQLDLVATQSLTGQTPLQAKIERLHEERLAAIDAIKHDQMVKKLQQVFAAELDEASVIKIQNNS
ncbi:MAG: hypothetical protein GY935_26370 [Gammaproteobacteria bacterium]|nr:hypothetical protein [Gammaproteobacteria bacterium]